MAKVSPERTRFGRIRMSALALQTGQVSCDDSLSPRPSLFTVEWIGEALMTRHPATILAAEMVGYSALMAEDRAGTQESLRPACAVGYGVHSLRPDVNCAGDCRMALAGPAT